MAYKVYIITFDNGYSYVGITRQTLKRRMSKHKCRQVNYYVHKYLNSGVEHSVAVVKTCETEDQARYWERQIIRNEEQPLNTYGNPKMSKAVNRAFGKGKRDYERSPMPQRCNLCLKTKDASRFHTDRSRSTGLHGRCKDCKNQLKASHVKNGVEGYRAMVAELRAEAKAHGKRLQEEHGL